MHPSKKYAEKWEDYRNDDPRCKYPWSPGPVGYCWSYAYHFDGDPEFADMSDVCPGCEFWRTSSR